MNAAGASLALDARAMALLDRLLDASDAERDAELQSLGSTDPALQARVARLLKAAADGGSSRAVAAPVLSALQAATATPHSAGTQLAGWRLLRLLGRGGMAEVWLAERADGGLKREAAIKLPLAPQGCSVLAERFARERDVLAALDHPHIARLYDAGVAADGQPYIVLECVAGLPITDYATAQQLSTPQRLALFTQVLAAVDHAHRHLVVHRDLKPGNILVDAQGQVKLLDFGIAKLLAPASTDAALTQDTSAVLTPRYAAPEQVLSQPVSTATDVYAAGVVLYELLTGRLPYQGDSVPGWMQAVAQQAPAPPGLSADLDTVLLKALRKAPGERYASAERFAEDLRRLLADEPILARPVPWWRRLQLLLRRHRMVSASAALGGLLLLAFAGYAWRQQRASVEQQARAAAVRNFLFVMLADAEPEEGSADVTGRQIVDAAVQRAGSEFEDQPVVRGEILVELGRVHMRMNRRTASSAVLNEAIKLLEPVVPPDHVGLNSARAWLAQNLITSDPDRALTLATQALRDCSAGGPDCSKALAHAHGSLRNLHAALGRSKLALEHARAALAASTTAFGAHDANTSAAWQSLAVVARNAGQYEEAANAIEQALVPVAHSTVRAAERITLQRTQAVIDIDLGRYEQARQRLTELLPRTDAPREQAIQWRMLSAAHWGMGDVPAALDAATRGLALAQAAGAEREVLYARQTRARALAMTGDTGTALQELRDVDQGLARLGFAAAATERLRARRLLAEAQLRQGDAVAAQATLATVLQDHAAAADGNAVDWGQALDLAGCAALAQGRADEARAQHAAAAARLGAALPAGHVLLLRNRVYAALAAVQEAPAAGTQDALQRALADFTASQPAGSAWLALLQTVERPPGTSDGAKRRAGLVL